MLCAGMPCHVASAFSLYFLSDLFCASKPHSSVSFFPTSYPQTHPIRVLHACLFLLSNRRVFSPRFSRECCLPHLGKKNCSCSYASHGLFLIGCIDILSTPFSVGMIHIPDPEPI
ncbi:hypothetical protein AAZX31_19G022900 [Glycine max]|nr:hypothetical protein GLYMA_19G024450v4 [Glycine max]KAH1076094.1 hypothetical protein GYH30_051818 [Glycine max]